MVKQHNCKEVKQLLKQLEQRGFTITAKTKSGSVKIIPPPNIKGSVYHTHATQSALHQLRRDISRMYDIKL